MSVVLVTGTSSGIGRAAVHHLLGHGAIVVATARRVADIQDLAQEGVEVLPLDVTDEASMQQAVATVIERHGRIDALVNNAGYGAYLPVEDTSLAAMQAMFDVNVFGAHRLTQMVLAHMHKQSPGRGGLRGRIVNVSSIAGHLAIGMMGGYCASKFALRALTTAMDQELRHFGIRASLVEPGRILTRFGHRALAETEKHASDRGPYGGMYRRWDRLRINEVGGKPDVIARQIRRACLARRPRFHYLAPWDAKSANLAKRLLPDSWLNRAVAGYIQPRRQDREPRSP